MAQKLSAFGRERSTPPIGAAQNYLKPATTFDDVEMPNEYSRDESTAHGMYSDDAVEMKVCRVLRKDQLTLVG